MRAKICIFKNTSFVSSPYRNSPLDETHLDAVRGLIELRSFHPSVSTSISSFRVPAVYHIVFSPVFRQAGVMSLEVKYDRFRNRDEGTWQKPLEILTKKDRWSELLAYVTDVMQPEEASRRKSINTHTRTRTRTLTTKLNYRIGGFWLLVNVA